MAADVSSVTRFMNEYKTEEDPNNKRDLITRDFLGCVVIGSKELDLDLKVPTGWERLDLFSGETYLQKSRSNPVNRQIHDLNLPPPPPDSSLDLNLFFPSSSQSVCTLEKVKSALERAERESQSRNWRSDGSASPSSSTTSSSMKRRAGDDREREKGTTDGSDSFGDLVAAGCLSCLLYVLISKGNPRCPRCDSHVPVTVTVQPKKPRIDLNSA